MVALNIYVNICSNVCAYWVSVTWVGLTVAVSTYKNTTIYTWLSKIIIICSITFGAYLSVFIRCVSSLAVYMLYNQLYHSYMLVYYIQGSGRCSRCGCCCCPSSSSPMTKHLLLGLINTSRHLWCSYYIALYKLVF